VISQIAVWAEAEALTDLKSPASNLTMGSRFAGFGLVLLQVLPHTTRTEDVTLIKSWLATLQAHQTEFWETGAPDKSRKGNLRAWAALSAAAAADILDDPVLRAWAQFSVSYVLCSAADDGSLPQEMTRGKYALKYQLHAIAPLVVTTLLLERKGIPAQDLCDGALARVIGFAVADLDSGAATEAITGKVQTFFDGSDKIEGFHLAWLEPYLVFDKGPDRPVMEKLAEKYRPLNYSKLGGDQALIWGTQ
jgi:poly(beta-D-mannuronate) lyase